MNFFARFLLFGLVGAVSFSGFGQVTSSSLSASQASTSQATVTDKVEMPNDPADLLELAAKKNGLQNVGTEPLHIKATYQLLEENGGVKETGTIEELRISAKSYLLRYSSPSFNQTDYSSDKGLFRVGDQKWPETTVWQAHAMLYPEFPPSEGISKGRLTFSEKKAGSAQMKCVAFDGPKEDLSDHKQTYCFDFAVPILRILESGEGVNQAVYNNIVPIQGAYVGRDAAFFQRGKAIVRVHLDAINAVTHVDLSELAPPSGARQILRRIDVELTGPVIKPVHEAKPEYPAIARAAKIQGTVVLRAIIGKDGQVVDAEAISGPPMLRQAALDAVRRQEYQPYSLDGEVVEVATRVNVVFMLSAAPPI
jgi:TonB family protein